MIRRLPVYLLIDCSESMIGGGLDAVRSGITSMLRSLRADPHALDTVHLAVITFDAEARLAVPLTPLLEFQEPQLRIRPGTSLGAALTLLANRIETDVVKTSQTTKADYRPLVLLLTDGQPTDNWRAPLNRIGTQVRPRPANIYSIGCGADVDYAVLQSMSDVVLRMEDMGPESFAKLFVWLTASVSSASQGMGEADGSINLQKLPNNVEVITGKAESLEEGPSRQVFLRIQCSVKKFHYLARYRFDSAFGCYQPVAAHRLSEEEKESATQGNLPAIPSNLLNGVPSCPWCESPGAGSCGNCGALFCSNPNGSSDVICPACGNHLKRTAGGQDSAGFSVRQSGG